MQFHFIGCGDAFGSGGRFNTCFHVTGDRSSFLIDCGATSLVAPKRAKVALDGIQTILITHFHTDHFGGIPPLILDAGFSKRTAPLTIAGPHGLKAQFRQTMETACAGSSDVHQRFELRLFELPAGKSADLKGLEVTPFPVDHGNPGGPCFAYRMVVEGKIIAYSGDTGWVDSLVEVGRGADLFVAEAYFRDRRIPLHLDLATLEKHLPAINPKRLILTHMCEDMLSRRPPIGHECAEDGMIITL